MSNHLFQQFRDRMKEPSRLFLETPDGRSVTYGDLLARSARLANALVALGVQPGDRVAVQVEKSVDALMLYLGCLRAGAVLLPLNTAYTTAELAYFIGDAEPALIVCAPERAAAIRGIEGVRATVATLGSGGEGSLMAGAADSSDAFADIARGPQDLAAILYTSGTTGRSKGAMISHENLASNARALVETWRFTEADVLIHPLPIFHTHGLFTATNTILTAGAAMIFLPRFDPDAVLQAMPRATTMMGVPTFYVRLLQSQALTREATRHMRLFISGSAPLLAETHAEWAARTGHAILERYGMTETNMITSNPYEGERLPGSVGHPLPEVEVRVVDRESGAAIAPGAIGMIEVRGPNVFSGYWRMPEKTKAEFRGDGFFITGDLGRIDERGYLHIVGRGKDLVITGGYNVYPKEVETEIDSLPGVLESAVIGVPDRDFGEAVTAIVVPRAGERLAEADIIAALWDRLARFKQPKRVFFIEELPRNTMGKVQKNVLREQFARTAEQAKV